MGVVPGSPDLRVEAFFTSFFFFIFTFFGRDRRHPPQVLPPPLVPPRVLHRRPLHGYLSLTSRMPQPSGWWRSARQALAAGPGTSSVFTSATPTLKILFSSTASQAAPHVVALVLGLVPPPGQGSGWKSSRGGGGVSLLERAARPMRKRSKKKKNKTKRAIDGEEAGTRAGSSASSSPGRSLRGEIPPWPRRRGAAEAATRAGNEAPQGASKELFEIKIGKPFFCLLKKNSSKKANSTFFVYKRAVGETSLKIEHSAAGHELVSLFLSLAAG